jgi:hypothetical protein
MACRSHWPSGLGCGSAAAPLLELWVRIPPGAWISVSWVMSCQVVVSAMGWSLVQRSRTECDESECDVNSRQRGGLGLLGTVMPRKKNHG